MLRTIASVQVTGCVVIGKIFFLKQKSSKKQVFKILESEISQQKKMKKIIFFLLATIIAVDAKTLSNGACTTLGKLIFINFILFQIEARS